MTPQTTEPAATLPITVAEAKAHLRIIDDGGEDTVIAAIIAAATAHIERKADHALVERTLVARFSGFPASALHLPTPPLIAVDRVEYFDAEGTLRVLPASLYWTDTQSRPGSIDPTTSWPATQRRPDAVAVTYRAGYGDAGQVPPDLVAAVKLVVGHLYENREATAAVALHTVPMAVESIVMEYARPRL